MGPIDAKGFEQLIRDVVVSGPTLVWSSGMAEWQPWAQVADSTAVCAASGGRYWQRDMVPYEGKFISAEFKEQYFQRLREGVLQPGMMHFAGFWIRFVAKLIDNVISTILAWVLILPLMFMFLGGIQVGDGSGQPSFGRVMGFQGLAMLIGIGIGLAYHWFFLSRFGATPGKMVFGLKVVRSDATPLTNGRIIGRFFAEMLSSLILSIGYIMAAFDEEKRSLHDRICDTRVIKAK